MLAPGDALVVGNIESELEALGISVQRVCGDGNCLFRTLSVFDPSRDHIEWRHHLCDSIQDMADRDGSHQTLLTRANDALSLRKDFEEYESWADLMTAMKSNQWGYSDFNYAFCLEKKCQIFCLDTQGRWTLIKPSTVNQPTQTFFMFLDLDEDGEHVPHSICVLLLIDCVLYRSTISLQSYCGNF